MEGAFHYKSDSGVVSVDQFLVCAPGHTIEEEIPGRREVGIVTTPPTATAPITSIPIRSAGSGLPGEAHVEDAIRDPSRAFLNHLLENQALTTTGTTTYLR
jgi:hypothetical protein